MHSDTMFNRKKKTGEIRISSNSKQMLSIRKHFKWNFEIMENLVLNIFRAGEDNLDRSQSCKKSGCLSVCP